MKVWRVAHNTANNKLGCPAGPYTAYVYEDDVDTMLTRMAISHRNSEHPPPRHSQSGLNGIAMGEVCALISLAYLHRWFEGWVEDLASAGFWIYVYEVPDGYYRVGKQGQVVFEYEAAELVDIRPLA